MQNNVHLTIEMGGMAFFKPVQCEENTLVLHNTFYNYKQRYNSEQVNLHLQHIALKSQYIRRLHYI